MNDWRRVRLPRHKTLMMVSASMALGGCGFWCTNFTIQNGLRLVSEDGALLLTDFELGRLVLSMVSATLGMFCGLKIASRDPYFLNHEFSRQQQVVSKRTTAWPSTETSAGTTETFPATALTVFSQPWRLAAGSACATIGVLGMHVAEMAARRAIVAVEVDLRVLACGAMAIFLAITVLLWVIFRVVSWSSLAFFLVSLIIVA